MSHRRWDFIALLSFGGAVLFIVCLYTSPATLFPALAPVRPALLGASAMLLGMGLHRLLRGGRWRLDAPLTAMLLLYAWAGLSINWALEPTRARGFFVEAVKLVLAYVAIVAALDRLGRLRRAITIAALASAVPAIDTLQRFNRGEGLVEGYRAAWIGLLANPNQLAMVMAVTVPLTLGAALHHTGRKRVGLLILAAIQSACVVVTYSRGGALGLAAAFLSFALFARHKLRALLLVTVGVIALFALAPRSFWERTGTIGHYALDASAMGRIRAWETGFRALGDRPVLGVGAGNYVQSWDRYQPRSGREHAYASHNMWLQVLVELGVVGLSLFVAMFLTLLWGLWAARRAPSVGTEARALLASFVALMVCGTTGGYAFNWFFYMVLGLASAVVRLADRHVPERDADGLGIVVA